MNWSVFTEVIVWAVTILSFISAYIALVVASEPLTERGARNSLVALIVSLALAVIGGATLAGMYAA